MRWFAGSISEAIAEAKSKNAVFIVYIAGEDEQSTKMNTTFESIEVSSILEGAGCVAVKLQSDSDMCRQFSQIYPVVLIPSTYFIGENGVPLEIIGGDLPPKDFLTKIDNVIKIKGAVSGVKDSVPSSGSHKDASSPASNNSVPFSSNYMEANSSVSGNYTVSSAVQELPLSGYHVEPKSNVSDNNTVSSAVQELPLSDNHMEASATASGNFTVNSALQEEVPTDNSLSSEYQDTPGSSIEERTEKVKQLLAERREQRLKQQAEEEKKRELERRKVGQDVLKLKQWQQNLENKEKAEDKAQERAARERVREQIARDRAERAARLQAEKREFEMRQQEAQAAALQAQQAKLSAEALARSQIARLQFRFPDGSSDSHQFSADDTLEHVRQYILQASRTPLRAFTLSTTFPRREFQEVDYSQNLRDLQLAPCAAILVLPIQHSLVPTPPASISNIFWTAIGPIIALLNYIRMIIFGRQPDNAEPHSLTQKSPPPNSLSEVPDSTLSSNRPITAYRRRNPDEPSSTLFSRKEGNIHRISNRKDDDDENNTWNGNSTQQM